MATYPGAGLAATPGFTGPGAPDVQDALRLKVDWLAYRTRNSRDQYESPTRTAVKPHPPTP